jgi:hypothetical protein
MSAIPRTRVQATLDVELTENTGFLKTNMRFLQQLSAKELTGHG